MTAKLHPACIREVRFETVLVTEKMEVPFIATASVLLTTTQAEELLRQLISIFGIDPKENT
jgi:hypothetical protein